MLHMYNVNATYIAILFVRRGLALKNFGLGLVHYGLGLDTFGFGHEVSGLDSITDTICTLTHFLTYLHKYWMISYWYRDILQISYRYRIEFEIFLATEGGELSQGIAFVFTFTHRFPYTRVIAIAPVLQSSRWNDGSAIGLLPSWAELRWLVCSSF